MSSISERIDARDRPLNHKRMSWLNDRIETFNLAVGVRRYVIGGAVGIVIAIFSGLKSLPPFASLPIPIWLLWVVVPLLLGAYWFFEFAHTLRMAAKPKIRLDKPVLAHSTSGAVVRMAVSNVGGEILRECIVRIVSISPAPSTMPLDFLPVAVPTDGQVREGRKGSFILRPASSIGGSGEEKHVTIFRWAKYTLDDTHILKTESDSIALDFSASGIFEVCVRAFSEAGASEMRRLRISSKADGEPAIFEI